MCGICGILGSSDEAPLTRMLKVQSYRGPDGLQVRTFGSCCIGAGRLAIFGDPDAKPIYEDKRNRRAVLLNGEIYNYRDLWSELVRDGCPPPQTDLEAELVSAMYERYGVDFPERLKGMFALAIVERSGVLLVRDRLGIKPLYYLQSGSLVAFASEIKALLQHPDSQRTLNQRALEEARVFGYVNSAEETLFNGIYQVPPGSFLHFDARGAVVERKKYFTPPSARYLVSESQSDYRASVEETRRLLIRASERMLGHGDQEKSVFLSGGLDSSIMALIAKRILGWDIRTYTIADQPTTADAQSANLVAAKLRTRHVERIVTLQDYWRALPRYIAHYEGMMAGGVFGVQGGVAFYLLVEKFARDGRVAFTGEGADELFGGYYWIYTHPLGFADKIRKNLTALPGDSHVREIVRKVFPLPESVDVYRRNLLNFLLGGGLTNHHLQSVDRSGGAFGVEIRPLYLDDDVVDYALNLPIEYKVPDNVTTKRILRDAFREDFEALDLGSVLMRRKMGMPSALEKLNDEVHATVDRLVLDEELYQHPLGAILNSKMNLLLYDIFDHVFFRNWDPRTDDPPGDSLLARVCHDSL